MKTNNSNRLTDKVVTVDDIMRCNPCRRYPESRVRELIGSGKTLLEIVDLPIHSDDILWVFSRQGIVPESVQHEFALRCAEFALWANWRADDDRPRGAIEAKRKWLRGEITEDALAAARSAANMAVHMSREKAEEGEDDRFDYRASEAALAAWYASSTFILDVVLAYTCMEDATKMYSVRDWTMQMLRDVISEEAEEES